MQYEACAMEANIIVWDLETVPDLRGFAAAVREPKYGLGLARDPCVRLIDKASGRSTQEW
jgi:hypothetical protein